MKYPWFRLYSELIHDPKIKRASRELNKSLPETVGYWSILLCLANESPERGDLMMGNRIPLDIEDLELYFEIHASQVEEILACFSKLGMIHYNGNGFGITNWSKRQFRSDNSTERVRKHREKIKHETLPKRYSNVIDTESDTDTEEESDTEEEVNANGIYSELSIAFVNKTGIPELTGGPSKWYDSLKRMGEAGVKAEDIEKAIDILRDRDYSIVRLSSIENTAIGEMSKRVGKNPTLNREKYVDNKYADFIEH